MDMKELRNDLKQITEDSFNELGFIKLENFFRIDIRDGLYLKCRIGDELTGVAIEEYDMILNTTKSISLKPIRYVHELQNLHFVLSGGNGIKEQTK